MASILVVDDTLIVLELTEEMLSLEQHQVRRAANAKDALALLEDKTVPIDLLLTDIVLPEMGGVELIARAREHRPHVPVIAMTGYGQEESKELVWSLVNLGISDLLRKPFRQSELVSAVNRVLSQCPCMS